MKLTHYKLTEELHKEFKVACAKEGKTMQEVFLILVKVWIKGNADK